MILKYLLPLIALTVVIALHELGHLIAGKFFKVKVEVFSIGIGKKILTKKYRGTEYALSLLPLGGYCKLKGGDLENPSIDSDSMDQLHPLKRAVIYFMGPLFNYALTLGLLFIVYLLPVHQELPNRVLPIIGESYPAEMGGLLKGDKILTINNRPIENYSDISSNITSDNLMVTIERDNRIMELYIKPQSNGSSYFIGVYPYIPLKVLDYTGNLDISINAEIIKVNETPVDNYFELYNILDDAESFNITMRYHGSVKTMILTKNDLSDITFIEYNAYNIFESISRGFKDVIYMSQKILDVFASLFKDGRVTETLSTPIRLIYEVGNSVESIYRTSSLLITINSFLMIMSSISLTLGLINLFPIPVLDGGQILINVITAIKGSPLNKKIIYSYQTVGLVIILLLFGLGLSNDIFFFGEIK